MMIFFLFYVLVQLGVKTQNLPNLENNNLFHFEYKKLIGRNLFGFGVSDWKNIQNKLGD